MNTTIQKWGNSYAVRLPKATVRKFKLKAGHPVEISETAHGRAFSITPARSSTPSLKKLLAGITKENRHESVDWGKPRGQEVW